MFVIYFLEGERGDFVDPVPFQSALLNELDGKAKFWIGKDYVNFIIKDLVNLDAPYAGEYRNKYEYRSISTVKLRNKSTRTLPYYFNRPHDQLR